MAEDVPELPEAATPAAPAAKAAPAPTGIKKLAVMVAGCRDDVDGESAKMSLVQSYVESNKEDTLSVLCQLHGHKVITLTPEKVLKAVTWKKGSAAGADDLVRESSHPGLFLANVLAGASASSMEALYKSYVASNPELDQVSLLQYVNGKGFLEYTFDGVLKDVSWVPPPADEDKAANWRSLWGRHIPEGTPWYATVRDLRGNKAKIAFLGSALYDGTPLQQPSSTPLQQPAGEKSNSLLKSLHGPESFRDRDRHRMTYGSTLAISLSLSLSRSLSLAVTSSHAQDMESLATQHVHLRRRR